MTELDVLKAENAHLKSEMGELTDLYTTYRGLVVDGQDITTLIETLRKKANDAQAKNEPRHRIVCEDGDCTEPCGRCVVQDPQVEANVPTDEDKRGGWLLIGFCLGVVVLSVLLALAHLAGWV